MATEPASLNVPLYGYRDRAREAGFGNTGLRLEMKQIKEFL
jgi:hypothetical protein